MAKAPIVSPDNSAETSTIKGKEAQNTGKGRPTPTRKEREAANLRPLVAVGKEERKAQRDRVADQRNRARIGLANGEEKFLPARDKGPQRKYVRDYIDARWSVGELMIPVMVIILISSLIPKAQAVTLYVLWAFVVVAVVDCLLVGQRIHTKLAAKYGKENVERGLRWYASMRALQLKIMRMPKSQIKRGQYPEL
ncbi:DUF3043 domain-containing protein [Frondihabitans cladoniiphilus]|uniref:DUF3043 family protein n=1 Tax=Frondihabitans cladoniiphilus TaxID=715785 RepID=A0ABP8W839_9MICO